MPNVDKTPIAAIAILSHRAAKLNAARNGLRKYIQVRGTNANTCVLTIEVGTWHTFARHDDRYDDRAQGSLCVLRVSVLPPSGRVLRATGWGVPADGRRSPASAGPA